MRLAGRVAGPVSMLVVRVVDVLMRMLVWFVLVFVIMNLCEMEPYAEGHQQTRCCERGRYRLLQEQNCRERA